MLQDKFFFGTKIYHDVILSAARPIINYLGVHNIFFTHVVQDNQVFNISSNLAWGERIAEKEYYKISPAITHPDNTANGFAFIETLKKTLPNSSQLLSDASTNFNWNHGFAYVEKIPANGCFTFVFGANKNNFQISSRLLNEQQIIQSIIQNLYKTLMLHIHKDIHDNSIDGSALKGDKFFTQPGIIYNKQVTEEKIQLLTNLGQPNNLKDFNLNAQEKLFLQAYLHTQNINQVYSQLNLNYSNIELLITNLKTKLQCKNNHQLLEKAEILENLGYV